jgi:hypothetical protein
VVVEALPPFIGWFREVPHLAAPHHSLRVASRSCGWRLAGSCIVATSSGPQLFEMRAGQHFAPSTEQNLPASGRLLYHRSLPCDGTYRFRAFPRPYWDTTRLPDGRYFIRVRVWDIAWQHGEGRSSGDDPERTVSDEEEEEGEGPRGGQLARDERRDDRDREDHEDDEHDDD